MAEQQYRRLSEDELTQESTTVNSWTIENGQLTKTFSFDEYLAGIHFATRAGEIAEGLDHHPDIHIYWRKVVLSVNTHAVEGLSSLDFEFARRIDALS